MLVAPTIWISFRKRRIQPEEEELDIRPRRPLNTWELMPPPPPTVIVNDFTNVFKSILDLINRTGIFGVNSVVFALTRDSLIKYPTGPPPFALLVPGSFQSEENPEHGGGRFTKMWRGEIEIIIVVRNVYDIAYKDTIAFTTTDAVTGMYVLAHDVINLVEQSFPYDANKNPTLVELPISKTIEAPYRYQDANEYIALPIPFEIYFQETLPAEIPVGPVVTWNPGLAFTLSPPLLI
jgi:hypothetical protein